MTLVSHKAGVGMQDEGVCVGGRGEGGGLAERNYCLAETDTPTNYSQVMKERNKNFMNVSEVQVFIAGLRLSGM